MTKRHLRAVLRSRHAVRVVGVGVRREGDTWPVVLTYCQLPEVSAMRSVELVRCKSEANANRERDKLGRWAMDWKP